MTSSSTADDGSTGPPSATLVSDGFAGVGPTPAVRAELAEFLEADGSRLGDVYRGLNAGMSPDEIAAQHGVTTSNFVYNYRTKIDALLNGLLPSSPSLALQAARSVRRMLSRRGWSADATTHLEAIRRELERRADDEDAREQEVEEAQEKTAKAESQNAPGVYVYALPHYLRYPYEPDTGRTLMKVGQSGSDVIRRFQSQTRTTALPEEPLLLRIYGTDLAGAADAERRFHALLEAADHSRSVARSAGREWFLTKTKFLDMIAQTLGLPIQVVSEAPLDDD